MFKTLLPLFLYASITISQGIIIVEPVENQIVGAGSDLTIKIERPYFIDGSEEIAIVCGLRACGKHACLPPSTAIGTVLYNGVLQPEFHEPYLFQYENITVQVPSSTPAGIASITVAHFSLASIEHIPLLATLDQTVVIN